MKRESSIAKRVAKRRRNPDVFFIGEVVEDEARPGCSVSVSSRPSGAKRVAKRRRNPDVFFIGEVVEDEARPGCSVSVSSRPSGSGLKKKGKICEEKADVIIISDSDRDGTEGENENPNGVHSDLAPAPASAAVDGDDDEEESCESEEKEGEADVSSPSSSSESESEGESDDGDYQVEETCSKDESEEEDEEEGSESVCEPESTRKEPSLEREKKKKKSKAWIGEEVGESETMEEKKQGSGSVSACEPKSSRKEAPLDIEEKNKAWVVEEMGKCAIMEESKRDGVDDQKEEVEENRVGSFKKPKKVDIFQLLVNSIWEKQKPIKDTDEEEEAKIAHPMKKEPLPQLQSLPQMFTFGEEEVVEKEDWELELDDLWEKMRFCLQSSEIGSTSSPPPPSPPAAHCGDANKTTICSHDLFINEEIGIVCRKCSLVKVEIRDVCPQMDKYSCERRDRRNPHIQEGIKFGVSKSYSSKEPSSCTEGMVWDVIPNLWEDLYPHQQEGFKFIWNNLVGSVKLDEVREAKSGGGSGCIINHAPGTGKTKLTIVFLHSFLQVFGSCKPVIIAPAGLLLTWEEEFGKWDIPIPFHNLNNLELSGKECPLAANVVLSGNANKNLTRMLKLFSWSKQKSVLGVSYNLYEKLVGSNSKKLQDMKEILVELPGLLVFDEGHTPRNQNSQIWKALSKIEAKRRIILSGTPFQNNFDELYNTVCLARPEMADNNLKTLCKRKKKSDGNDIEKIKAIISPFVHVHKGVVLEKNLPGLKSCAVVLSASDIQMETLGKIDQSSNTFKLEHKLSLVSIHPSLLLECGLSEKEEASIDRDMLQSIEANPDEGVKTRFLVAFMRLCQAMNENEKVLVFSQYLDPLKLIARQLCSAFGWDEGKQVLLMHGTLKQKQRQALIRSFNDSSSESRVMVASIKACSEGINLVGASRVILLDVVWNPSVERQAISRAYRLGQKRIVYTYHLIIKGTAECDKYLKQAQKDKIAEMVFTGNNNKESFGCGADKSGMAWEDKILDEMVGHKNLTDMFDKIIYQPKQANLVQSFGH